MITLLSTFTQTLERWLRAERHVGHGARAAPSQPADTSMARHRIAHLHPALPPPLGESLQDPGGGCSPGVDSRRQRGAPLRSWHPTLAALPADRPLSHRPARQEPGREAAYGVSC